MKISYFIFFILIFCIKVKSSVAQVMRYQRDTSIKVYAYGSEQPLAWCGGFNYPQFTMGDLNNDGLQDLVILENFNSVRTFINMGTTGNPNYIYSPEYELNFPPIYDYLTLADYNCDGIPDLFQQGGTGFAVYKGYYNAANQLCFTFYKNLNYINSLGESRSILNNPGDIPAIVDVDNDGDLDFLAYDVSDSDFHWYKNMRVELGLPCDSITIGLANDCWGLFSSDVAPYLELGCNYSSHSGNTACVFDYDMDGDYDYLGGKIGYNQSFFLLNGRIPYNTSGPDSMVHEDTTWQSSGVPVNLPSWPAAFNVDVDQDGKKDLLIAPNYLLSENYKCIWYYKNFSTTGTANWQFQSDTFMIDKTIDLGTAAYPSLFDYNHDGLPDLFIGSDGYYQDSTQSLHSRISYYLNTSILGNPSFELQTNDFLGINSYNFQGAAPAFGDIDNDGKADMIIGHSDGTLSYFKNMAASGAVQPVWMLEQQTLTDHNGDTINVGGNAAPFVYDIDKDGRNDPVIGDYDGYLQYYRNITTIPGTISLQLINTELGGAKADPAEYIGTYSAPFIGKIDTSGTDYLLMGSNSGNLYEFTGFQSGDTSATYTLVSGQFDYIDSTYNAYYGAGAAYAVYGDLRSTVTVGDIAGDGSLYMIVGNVKGGVELYKQKAANLQVPSLSASAKNKIELYPNPATNELTITSTGKITTVAIHNLLGQSVCSQYFNTQQAHLNISGLPPALYFVTVNGMEVRKFVKE